MKLVHPYIEQNILFSENKINVLVIENKKIFSELLWEFKKQIATGEGRFVLSDDQNEVNMKNKVDIIFNPFELDLSQRKIVTQLYKELFNIGEDEGNFMETRELSAKIIEYMEKIIIESKYAISMDIEFDMTSLYKGLGVRIDSSQENILELLTEYIKLIRDLLGVELFILVNINVFLTYEDIELLYQCVMYEKINILVIESTQPEKHIVDSMIIIDEDCCEINIE